MSNVVSEKDILVYSLRFGGVGKRAMRMNFALKSYGRCTGTGIFGSCEFKFLNFTSYRRIYYRNLLFVVSHMPVIGEIGYTVRWIASIWFRTYASPERQLAAPAT